MRLVCGETLARASFHRAGCHLLWRRERCERSGSLELRDSRPRRRKLGPRLSQLRANAVRAHHVRAECSVWAIAVMHRHRAGVVGSDTRLCFELFHPLRHGTLCGRAFAILPKSNNFAAFCHWWSR